MEIIFFICLCFLNFFTFKKINFLTDALNLYDVPDNNRKIHLKKVPKIGGLILYLNYIIYLIFNFLNNYNIEDLKLFLIITLSFFISLQNDKKEIKPTYRLIIFYLIFFVWIIIDNGMLIQNLEFKFNNININLGLLGYLITPLFILIFFNALNLYDGVNLQSVTYILIFSLFFYLNNIDISAYIFLSIFILIFVFFNFKNQIFFGDSGITIFAIIISYLIITNYNKQGNLFCDEIFLIMFLPGIDMLRVYFLRIIRGKNPFKPDKNHIHHYLLNKFSHKYIFLFQIIFYLPILYMIYFAKIEIFFVIILMFLIYIFAIVFLNGKKILS